MIPPHVLDVVKLKFRLWAGRRTTICFDLPSLGEWQFIGPVVREYLANNPSHRAIIVHHRDTIGDFGDLGPDINGKCIHVRRSLLNLCSWPELAIFVTSEQYDLGLDSVYSATMFHGQAAKGLSFTPAVIETFDALFLNGPIHLEAYKNFVGDFLGGSEPNHLDLFEIGYPKSDALLNGAFSQEAIATALKLDRGLKTVLYAPAFNEGASLRESGLEIIEALAVNSRFNVLVKLPIDCWDGPESSYATGGVDWFARIRELEPRFPNLRFYTDYQIDPLLACADVLVTCISSVGFEFMALGKPVVFVDTPKYFSGYLAGKFPDRDISGWADRVTVNGGKEFGLVVSHYLELPGAIETVLSRPDLYPPRAAGLLSYLLYNPGSGAHAAATKIRELAAARMQTRRPHTKPTLIEVLAAGVWRRLFRPFRRQASISRACPG